MCDSPMCSRNKQTEPLADWERELLLLDSAAPFRVTYLDGTEEVFQNVRYQVSLGKADPVKVNGSTVQIETAEAHDRARVITLLNVRWFEFL